MWCSAPQHTACFLQHKYRVFLICATGIFVTVFDVSAALVALPTIAAEFGADLTVAQWVVNGTNLTIAALLVPAGRLSDLIGRKLIYVVGTTVFAAGAAVCLVAPSIGWLILARCIAGVGCAATQGTGTAILVSNFAPNERARMLGLQLAGVGLGGMAGPAFGGLIVGAVGWRTLFAISMIAMLINGIAAQLVLRKRPKRPEDVPPFDFVGAVLFSLTLVSGLLTLTLAPRAGLSDPGVVTGMCTFIVLAFAFVITERRVANPMLDFRLLRNAALALGGMAAITLFLCLSASRFLTPFYLQAIKGYDPSRVGLLMLPAAAVTVIVAPVAGRLADRFGVRLFANTGFAIAIAGLGIYSLVQTSSPTWLIVSGLMTLALGMSFFNASNSASILNSVTSESYGIASGFVNLCRTSGNVLGVAFCTALVTWTMGNAGYRPSLSEVRESAGIGLFEAFTLGMRSVAQALMLLAVPVLVIVTTWSIMRLRKGRR